MFLWGGERFDVLQLLLCLKILWYFVRKESAVTWHPGWDTLNGCADPAAPVTGPADSPPVLDL